MIEHSAQFIFFLLGYFFLHLPYYEWLDFDVVDSTAKVEQLLPTSQVEFRCLYTQTSIWKILYVFSLIRFAGAFFVPLGQDLLSFSR